VSSINLVAAAKNVIESAGYQSFCSVLLGYTQPVSTNTVYVTSVIAYTTTFTASASTFTSVPTVTVTQTAASSISTFYKSTVTTSAVAYTAVYSTGIVMKRDIKSREDEGVAHANLRRQILPTIILPTNLLSIPTLLGTYSSNILSSACSGEVTSATSTSVIYTTISKSTSSVGVVTVVPVRTVTGSAVTVTQTITSGISIITVSATTITSSYTKTTTIIVASSAPTGSPTYLQNLPQINPGASYAISDPATHMTDNYFVPTTREVFVGTSNGGLYSITHNAWYFTWSAAPTSGKLYWDTINYSNSTFYQTPNATVGYNRLFMKNPSTGNPYEFCLSNIASKDNNAKTGYHHYYYPSIADFPSDCIYIQLFLQPVSLGA
jgi:hypothetical protein